MLSRLRGPESSRVSVCLETFRVSSAHCAEADVTFMVNGKDRLGPQWLNTVQAESSTIWTTAKCARIGGHDVLGGPKGMPGFRNRYRELQNPRPADGGEELGESRVVEPKIGGFAAPMAEQRLYSIVIWGDRNGLHPELA